MNKQYRILILISIFILCWIGIIKFISYYFKTNVDNEWNEVYREQTGQQKKLVTDFFNASQQELLNLSKNISENLNIKNHTSKNEIKKLFEDIETFHLNEKYNLEIYNKYFEQLAFNGRRIDPEYNLLQKGLSGNTFSVIKETGFNTYLVVVTPVNDFENGSVNSGILLISEIIDSKYRLKNTFFSSTGIFKEMREKFNINPAIFPANIITGKIQTDTLLTEGNEQIDLYGIDSRLIGKITIPSYNREQHLQKISVLENRIESVLVFFLSVIVAIVFIVVLKLLKTRFLRVILFFLLLVLIRYFWLQFDFPAGIYAGELFSPSYFASLFGYGIMKSAGELFVTSFFFLAFAVYASVQCFQILNARTDTINIKNSFLRLLNIIFLLLLLYLLIDLYGITLKSIIFDSNVRFFDRTKIIPDFALFTIQLIVLIISFSFYALSCSIMLIVLNQLRISVKNVFLRKYWFVIIPAIIILINYLYELLLGSSEVNYVIKIIIVLLLILYSLYVFKNAVARKKYVLFSLRNFSIIILFCIITAPAVLLDKIKSLETRYIELIGNELSDDDEDKIIFKITNELNNMSNIRYLENNIRDRSKYANLAFYLWSESKLDAEDYNSAVIILDTNFKIISDFNLDAQRIITDSIVYYIKKNVIDRKLILNIPDWESDTAVMEYEDTDTVFYDEEKEENLTVKYDKTIIVKNSAENYIAGLIPVEIADLKNTQFASNVGYIILAINSEIKNVNLQPTVKMFRSYSRDNILNKLISKPIITEFKSGEIIYSSDVELSKNIEKTLDYLRQFLKDKSEKKTWRFDNFNNEKYRTFYVLKGNIIGYYDYNENDGEEKIIAISLKREDISEMVFYYLKFILFVLLIYVVFYIIFSLIYIRKLKEVKINFREKLFISFFIVSIIPIIILAVYTRSYITGKNELNLRNQLVSDLNSTSEMLKDVKIPSYTGKYSDSVLILQRDAVKRNFFSIDKNYNFYFKTRLLATTNDELYKSDLLDTRIESDAYFNIVYLKKDLYLKTQNIGGLSYLVGYKPFKNKSNTLSGIISSQLLYKQNEINEELTETLTFILGTYLIVVIILLMIVSYLSVRISRPLLELKHATDKLSGGQMDVQIKSRSKDEIGYLIDSFNKMTRELKKSREKIKKAERDAVWRDIARRVAHEIRNPLTPMRLSIQHLYSMYKEKKTENFEETLTKTKDLIVNEIDKLDRIASEFYKYASMPKRNYETLNINPILEDIISLYEVDKRIEFRRNLNPDAGNILGDREELNRIFQNIIKNSIQAIRGSGYIEIITYNMDNYVCVEIIDNGPGMEKEIMEKLFEPNFSTKTKGTGLGLAITKKALDDMKAEISYTSEVNKGTKVTVKFLKS